MSDKKIYKADSCPLIFTVFILILVNVLKQPRDHYNLY